MLIKTRNVIVIKNGGFMISVMNIYIFLIKIELVLK